MGPNLYVGLDINGRLVQFFSMAYGLQPNTFSVKYRTMQKFLCLAIIEISYVKNGFNNHLAVWTNAL